MQPNLEGVNDTESAYEAFLYLSRQLPGKITEIIDDINDKISLKETLDEKVRGIEEYRNLFIEQVFQPLMQRVADISPSSPDERDHPLREFNHEITGLPLNLGQNLINQLITDGELTKESLEPFLTYVLIRNSHEQVFIALATTKQPIWKK